MPRVKEKRTPQLEDLPESFRLAMIKLMSSLDLADLNIAFAHAALLLDSNSRLFKEAVNREAESRYRARHISELNKARETIRRDGYNLGYSKGYTKGTDDSRINFYCSKCGGELFVTPNSECHKKIREYLRGAGWAHSECLKG